MLAVQGRRGAQQARPRAGWQLSFLGNCAGPPAACAHRRQAVAQPARPGPARGSRRLTTLSHRRGRSSAARLVRSQLWKPSHSSSPTCGRAPDAIARGRGRTQLHPYRGAASTRSLGLRHTHSAPQLFAAGSKRGTRAARRSTQGLHWLGSLNLQDKPTQHRAPAGLPGLASTFNNCGLLLAPLLAQA